MNILTKLPILLAIFLTSFTSQASSLEPLELSFEINPRSNESNCGQLTPENDHPGFAELLSKNYVSVVSTFFDQEKGAREAANPDLIAFSCKVTVKVRFPSVQDFHKHIESIHGCLPYTFFGSGADYYYMLAVMKHAAKVSDLGVYQRWMAKNANRCPSEQNHDVFDELKKNEVAFLTVFKELSNSERQLVIENLYYVGATIDQMSFGKQDIDLLPVLLRDSANSYNNSVRAFFER